MGLFDLIFPKNCLECGKNGKYICNICLEKTSKSLQLCPVCAKFSLNGKTHTLCNKPLGLDGLISFWKYEGVIRKAILALKYKFAEDITKELSVLGSNELENYKLQIKNCILIPIPLHKRRKNWRGFNQAEVLGEKISNQLSWGYENEILVRKLASTPQVKLGKNERLRNLSGKFAVNKSKVDSSQFVDKTIILFDDVWTTGATMRESCKTLKRSGVKNVWGLTLVS